VTYGALSVAHVLAGKHREALGYLDKVHKRGMRPTRLNYTAALQACCRCARARVCVCVRGGRCGVLWWREACCNTQLALAVLTSDDACPLRLGDGEKAAAIVEEMKANGVEPDATCLKVWGCTCCFMCHPCVSFRWGAHGASLPWFPQYVAQATARGEGKDAAGENESSSDAELDRQVVHFLKRAVERQYC
jgi:pentatricopeptide repeat protein